MKYLPISESVIDRLVRTTSPAELRSLAAYLAPEAFEAPRAPVEALITQDQLAKALNCSTRTVFTMRQQGCPHLMLLESPRFILADVVRWMENRAAA